MWIIITIITPHLISSPTSPFHLSSHNIVHHSSTSSIHVFYGFKCTQGSSLDGEGYDRERNTATLYFPLRCPPPTPWRGWGSTHIVIQLRPLNTTLPLFFFYYHSCIEMSIFFLWCFYSYIYFSSIVIYSFILFVTPDLPISNKRAPWAWLYVILFMIYAYYLLQPLEGGVWTHIPLCIYMIFFRLEYIE